MKVSFSIVLDRRKSAKNGLFPVALRVYWQRNTKYIRVGEQMTEETFSKANTTRPRGEYKEIKAKLTAISQRAENVLKSLDQFNFDIFKKRFIGGQTDETEILSRYRTRIKQLEQSGKIGNGKHIKAAYNQIKKYIDKDTLYFYEIDKDWLMRFERWYVDRGYKARSAGIVLQTLRTIINDAIYEGVIHKSPFGKRGYMIPKSSGTPRALKMGGLKKIWSYKTEIEQEREALLYFKLIYLWSGINMHDLLALKWENIQGDTLSFQRGKTRNTSGKVIRLPVNEDVRKILAQLSYSSKAKEWILPVYEGTKTVEERHLKKRNKIKWLNKWLNRIGAKLGIELKLTSYVGRHTYATISNKLGVPLSHIQESLGHTDIKTTQNYLDKFENEKAKEFQNRLTDFGDDSEGERASDG